MDLSMLPTAIDYLLSSTLVLAIMILGARTLKGKIYIFMLQSLGLSLILACQGILHGETQAVWVAVFIALGKCIVVPGVLFTVLRKVPMKKSVESFFPLPTAMLIGGALIMLAHYLTIDLFSQQDKMFNSVFSTGTSLVFIGMMVMMTFKKAFTQIIGLYVLDNGIFCLALATVFEMPLLLEGGILFELSLGIIVLGIFVYRINQSFDTINVDYLKELHD